MARVNCTNYLEGGQAGSDLHLHVDCARLDAFKCDGGYPLNHAAPSNLGKASLQLSDAQEH